jgi:hypothetical protein
VTRRWHPDEFRDAVIFWAVIIGPLILLAFVIYMVVR